MAKIEMIMPKMGESVAEATVLKWLKNVGDKIEADEPVLEIATDKVDSDVPSPAAGILAQRMFEEGQVVQVGAVIAVIETDAKVGAPSSNGSTAPAAKQEAKVEAAAPVMMKEAVVEAVPYVHAAASAIPAHSGDRFYSPLVKNIAKQENISLEELNAINGSGDGGRVTKNDLLNYIKTGKKPVAAKVEQPVVEVISKPSVSVSGDVEIIEMDRMRKLIAEHMVMSKRTSPHVTSYVEIDVTNMVQWRDKNKGPFEKREKEKITFTPLFLEAVAKALRDFPMVNVSVEGTNILVKKNINIGMATALPSGNLIVPVIKKADTLNLLGLTKAVNDLANRARNNKLSPDDIQGGTFTVTNVGTFGNSMGTPIINQPQVAILATGSIKKKPAVIETPQGDLIGIRHMMFLSLSYDHRVVDGALGGSFLRRIGDYLEQFDPNRTI
ncbi:MAG: dihydrolipoamide acetyltransferase family protein [Bacteroidota bacterium]